MRFNFISFSFFLLISFFLVFSLNSQSLIPGKPIIDYLPDKNIPYSKPSKKDLKKLAKMKNISEKMESHDNPNGSAFTFTFNNGIDPTAKEIFLEAGKIWSQYIFTQVPIHVKVNFTPLEPNVLGSAGPKYYGFNNEYTFPNNYYFPISLYKKLTESYHLNNLIDIDVNFNSDFSNWYIGMGTPGSNQYDLLTVALHELSHGLGFIGFFGLNSQNPSLGILTNEKPSIFDNFIRYKAANLNLVNNASIPNNSITLKNALVSDSLFLVSQAILDSNSQTSAKLYAPATFNAGSSVYHLDEFTYPFNNPNALMTPSIAAGEVKRELGPILKAYMKTVGYTRPVVGRRQITKPFFPTSDSITLTAKGYFPFYDSNYELGNARLYYIIGNLNNRLNNAVANKTNQEYSVKIPIPELEQDTLIYYVWEMQVNEYGELKTYYSPQKTIQGNLYVDSLQLLVDDLKPSIEKLNRIDTLYFDQLNREINFPDFLIKDSSGIEEVKVFFQINSHPIDSIRINSELNQRLFQIKLDNIYFEDGDSLTYWLEAKEYYYKKRKARFPETGKEKIILNNQVNYNYSIQENFLNKNIQINTTGEIDLSSPINGNSEVELKGRLIKLSPGTKIDSSSGTIFRAKPQ